MSRVLLDTSAYSALLRGDARIHRCVQEADGLFVNPVILGELKAGFARGRHRKKNDRELASFLASSRVSVIPLDEDSSERYAVILGSLRSAGTPIPTNDVWIAASAMQYGLQVVTMDRHFQKVPQVLVEFFEPAEA